MNLYLVSNSPGDSFLQQGTLCFGAVKLHRRYACKNGVFCDSEEVHAWRVDTRDERDRARVRIEGGTYEIESIMDRKIS